MTEEKRGKKEVTKAVSTSMASVEKSVSYNEDQEKLRSLFVEGIPMEIFPGAGHREGNNNDSVVAVALIQKDSNNEYYVTVQGNLLGFVLSGFMFGGKGKNLREDMDHSGAFRIVQGHSLIVNGAVEILKEGLNEPSSRVMAGKGFAALLGASQ